ncbi:hypothetical protein [Bacillus andreraoultii]|uniref:hypothetical protein n=1 Tax=Bacillus andreraoultii TaxID=1499685 RepID=UPI00053B5528|nr:hypothetical protein [Bacillus andreraoultii]
MSFTSLKDLVELASRNMATIAEFLLGFNLQRKAFVTLHTFVQACSGNTFTRASKPFISLVI